MENKAFRRYFIFLTLGLLALSFYPIYMGASVITDMIKNGTVYAENYPKYIIPYTPISAALIVGTLLMPLLFRLSRRYSLLIGSSVSCAVFFGAELLLERLVTVTRTVTETVSSLENWQMYMCYVPKDYYQTVTRTEVDILMGEYSPAFKMHFYIISLVLIISILNCFYGFGEMIKSKNTERCKPLILQSAASGAFLGMCIWACFTAFYRNGEITVSPLSAALMCIFFVLFGVTVGIYVCSFTLKRRPALSVLTPALCAAAVTLLMYIGEMILLSGNLYRFGEGFFFEPLPAIVLAPIDILVIVLSGGLTAIIAYFVSKKKS